MFHGKKIYDNMGGEDHQFLVPVLPGSQLVWVFGVCPFGAGVCAFGAGLWTKCMVVGRVATTRKHRMCAANPSQARVDAAGKAVETIV